MNGPIARDCKTKDCADGGWLDHWTERLVTVNTKLLTATIGNQTSLVTAQSSSTTVRVLESEEWGF
nr:hypothetical protein [Tanacetum cinerariifolium]GEZ11181.1 hypothetical protein [Tanacetum cinerariifolium]